MMKLLHRFAIDQRGTAAIEFAFTFPMLLTLTIGMFEVAGFVSANMKLANTAQLISNLVAQQSIETNALTTNFCNGGQMALAPLPTTSMKVSVASVTHKTGGTAVDWVDNTCGGSGITGAVTLAGPLTPNVGDSVIIVQVSYLYASPVSYVLATSYALTQTSFTRPRNVPNITHT